MESNIESYRDAAREIGFLDVVRRRELQNHLSVALRYTREKSNREAASVRRELQKVNRRLQRLQQFLSGSPAKPASGSKRARRSTKS